MMKRVLLLSPPLTLEKRYGSLGKGGSNMPPIGLLYLGSILRKSGYEAFLLDPSCPERSLEDLIKEIVDIKPDYVGISVPTMAIKPAAIFAKELKQALPHIKSIIGGPHISAVPEATMERYPEFDIGVLNEGEYTLIELLEALNSKSGLDKVKGIVYRESNGLFITPQRPFIDNLDELPYPAWDLLPPLENYKLTATRFQDNPTASFISSRGCFGRCTFCDVGVFGRRIRGHSSEYVLNMIDQLIKGYNVKSLIFNDDTLAYNKKRLEDICKGIRERFSSIPWSCSSRIDLMKPDTLEMMRKSGCFQIAYGIESGVQSILDSINKGITLNQIKQVVEWTDKAGIRAKGYFMLGFPDDTVETIRETAEFAKSLPLSDFQMTFLTPFPGSAMYEIASKEGQFENDWEKMNMWEIVFIPKGITKKELVRERNRAFRGFYLRARILIRYISLLIKSPRFLPLLFNDFYAFLKMVLGLR
jgi:anaerobic magnesium-protoporphyrin IX monomethyl ester cyclase